MDNNLPQDKQNIDDIKDEVEEQEEDAMLLSKEKDL